VQINEDMQSTGTSLQMAGSGKCKSDSLKCIAKERPEKIATTKSFVNISQESFVKISVLKIESFK